MVFVDRKVGMSPLKKWWLLPCTHGEKPLLRKWWFIGQHIKNGSKGLTGVYDDEKEDEDE